MVDVPFKRGKTARGIAVTLKPIYTLSILLIICMRFGGPGACPMEIRARGEVHPGLSANHKHTCIDHGQF